MKWQEKRKKAHPARNCSKQIIEQYNPKSVADMQNALKDIFGPMFEAMLQGEMNAHLGYESNDHGAKKQPKIAETATQAKRIRPAVAKWISRYLVTETQALNRCLFQSAKKMYQK